MKPSVKRAVEELREGLPSHSLRVKEDDDGGAFVLVEGMDIGESFDPRCSSVGFHITWPYPDADVYPHFLDGSIRYVGTGPTPNENPDGALPPAMTRGHKMPGFEIPAIQVSRSSNRRNSDTDSALQKLLRVVESVRSR